MTSHVRVKYFPRMPALSDKSEGEACSINEELPAIVSRRQGDLCCPTRLTESASALRDTCPQTLVTSS